MFDLNVPKERFLEDLLMKYLKSSLLFPGQQALKQIGSVIRNPEIQAISDVLLAAISDPSRKTSKCLHTLLHTKYIIVRSIFYLLPKCNYRV